MHRAVPAVPRPDHRPGPLATEVSYFLQIETGPAAEAAFLDALARSELIVEPLTGASQPVGSRLFRTARGILSPLRDGDVDPGSIGR
jgi:hypothetical protein